MRFILFAYLLFSTYSGIVLAKDNLTISEIENNVRKKCITDLGFTEKAASEEMEKIIKGTEGEIIKNKKCLFACLYKGYNFFKKDGSIDINAAIIYHEAENLDSMKKAIRECGTMRGNNECDTAFSYYFCMGQKTKN